jgi:hypothetical protein
MKSLTICIFSLFFLLTGCKTAQEFAGSGDLVLHPQVKEFVDKITKSEGMVAVAYNGNYAYGRGCPEMHGCVSGGFDAASLIELCEKGAPRCAMYSEEGFVLWKGNVTVR